VVRKKYSFSLSLSVLQENGSVSLLHYAQDDQNTDELMGNVSLNKRSSDETSNDVLSYKNKRPH
jgi:hypothetical protein